MATHIVETNVSNLKINKLTQAQYIQAVQQGVIGDNELSIITDVVDGVVTVMPTASAEYLGSIVQFAGTTDANYTNGYFYKCVSDGANPPVYSWTRIDVQPQGDSLPSQTGQSGKFLTTDGTDASWSDKPLVNKATGTSSVCTDIATSYIRSTQFGSNAIINGNFATGIGFDTRVGISGTAVGAEAYATSGKNVGFGTAIGRAAVANGNASIALGAWATANGVHSIQIGGAGGIANYDNNTMNVCLGELVTQNYKLLLSDGTIPEARLADMTNASQGQVLTLDSNNNAVWATPSSGGSVPTLTWYTISTAGNTLTIADTSSAQLVKIYKNGLLLQPTEDYTISGTTLTTVSAMVVGDKITTEVF